MLETKVQPRAGVWLTKQKLVGLIPSNGRVGRQIFMQTGLKLATNLILKSGQ